MAIARDCIVAGFEAGDVMTRESGEGRRGQLQYTGVKGESVSRHSMIINHRSSIKTPRRIACRPNKQSHERWL